MAKLLIQLDGQPVRQVQLSKERTTLGRHPRSDIVLDDPAVSGEHGVIVTILDDSHLEDLGSTNGTFVNGYRVGKHFLQHRDKITLGRVELEFIADGVRPMMAAAPVLAHIEVLNGNNAGKQMALTKPQTTLGRAGAQVAVIHRQPDAYTISHLDGGEPPLVNGIALGPQPRQLNHGDLIDLGGTQMAFRIA